MALHLVITASIPGYVRGAIINDPSIINQIRTSEYATAAVLVSDTVVAPPTPPTGDGGLAYAQLLALYNQVAADNVAQQNALIALVNVNNSQNDQLLGQSRQIADISAAVSVLQARIGNGTGGNGGGGPSVPYDPSDDVPLAENDGVQIATTGGVILVGDIR